jgi:HD-GYP domain-containing protein (c-di-GMP phosphodiesterase class II)
MAKPDKVDFLAACRATDSRNKALEEIRDKGSEVILAIFRLLKNSLVHALGNKAVQTTVKEAHGIIGDFASIVGGYVSITFVDETIFICGQLLRASRSIYESAMEVGKMLAVCGVSEVSFTGELQEADLLAFCDAFATSVREPDHRNKLLEAKLSNVVVRQVDSSLQKNETDEDLPNMEKTLRAYASALVVLRQFYERMAQGKTVLPHRVKRVAQRMVSMAEADESALLGLSTLANAHREEAGRAVQTAILSIIVARRLTTNRNALSQLAMSALMADVGRVRIAGNSGEKMVQLSEDVEKVVPALTSSLCISTGGVNIHNALRTVTAYEANYIERAPLLGPIYKRTMSPMTQSKILHVVRQLLERLAPRDMKRPMSPLDAMAELAGQPNIDELVYKLLIQAVGVMPTGTVVEFETGEWGIVIGPSTNRAALARPRVKLITDRSGQVFAKPKEIDLGASSQGGKRFPRITGIIEPSKARFNVTGVLMAESTPA